MAITINYAPAASQYGTAGFLAGRGAYDTEQKKRQQDLQLAIAELQQRGQLSAAQIAASRQNTLDSLAANRLGQLTSIAANQQQQALDIVGRERSKLFDFYAGQADRFQTAQLNSALAQQKAVQDAQANQLDLQNNLAFEQFQNELEIQQNRQKEAARLDYAQRQQEQKRLKIEGEAQRRVDAVNKAIADGRIPRQAGLDHIARITDEAQGLIAGADSLPSSLGPTPQEQLASQFNDEVFIDPRDGTEWVRGDDGVWQRPRGWVAPEQKAEDQAKAEQKAADAKMKMEQEKHAAKLKADAAKLAMDMASKMVKKQTGKDRDGKPIYEDQPLFNTFEEAETAANAIYGIGKDAADEIEGFTPANEPTLEQLTGGGQQQESAPPQQPGQPQASVPDQPATRPNRDPREARRNPITSLQDFAQFGNQVPEDMTAEEWQSVGSNIMPDMQAAGLRDAGSGRGVLGFSQLPAETRQSALELHDIAVRIPDGPDAPRDRAAVQSVMGAVATFGPVVKKWPPDVIATLLVQLNIVQSLKNNAAKLPR